MKHFVEKEFWCRCSQCQKGDAEMGIPPGGMIGSVPENVKALVENVLDPLREKYGKPIRVNSGYRCPKHNLAVGGATGSQHMKGEASDITAGSPEENEKLVKILLESKNFDQLIIYPTLTSSTSDATRDSSNKLGSPSLLPRFVHVSWKRFGPNRKQTLRKVSNGYQKV